MTDVPDWARDTPVAAPAPAPKAHTQTPDWAQDASAPTPNPPKNIRDVQGQGGLKAGEQGIPATDEQATAIEKIRQFVTHPEVLNSQTKSSDLVKGFLDQNKDDPVVSRVNPKQVAAWIDYYRQPGTENTPLQFSKKFDGITVTGKKESPESTGHAVASSVVDAGTGVKEGYRNVQNDIVGLLTKGSDALGLTDNAHDSYNRAMDEYVSPNNDAEYQHPDGWSRSVGKFVGEGVALAPVTELKVLKGVTDAAKYANMAAQGAAAGGIMSGGNNITENAAVGALAGPVLGASLEAVTKKVGPKLAEWFSKKTPEELDVLVTHGINPEDLPPGVTPDEAKEALTALQGLKAEAEKFKGSADPKPEDVFPAPRDHEAEAEGWAKKLGAPESPPEPVAPSPSIKEAPTLSKKDAEAQFPTKSPNQTVKQWEKSLQAAANDFVESKASPSVSVEAPQNIAAEAPNPDEAVSVANKTDAPEIVASPEEVTQRLTDALNEAGKLTKEQKALNTATRSDKIKKVLSTRKVTGGEAGLRAELSQLEGKFPKVDFEGVRQKFTQAEIDGLFDHIKHQPKLTTFEQINARIGLAKLLDGSVPTPSELSLLGKVFPKDFVQAAVKHKSLTNKVMDFGANALNLPRSLMASVDLSAPFRQGIFLVGRKEFWKGFQTMFKTFGDEKAFAGMMDDIRGRPTYPLMERSGLALTDAHGGHLTAKEEQFMSQWAENIPVAGHLVKASERAYTGFLNKVRADTFDSLVRLSREAGINFDDNPKALKDIASFVNNATGRGNLGKLNQAGPLLNGLFFSPRLIASRLTMLNPAYYVNLSPVVRKEAIKSLLSFGGLAVTVASLAKAGGADVEPDPRSSDFMKIKTGNTRYDILGGFGQYITLGARLATNETKNAKGVVKTLGKKYGDDTRLDVSTKFGINKFSPVASFVADYLRGTDPVGEPFEVKKEVISRFIPLFLQDSADVIKENGAVKGAAMSIPGLFGVGMQTYEPKLSKKELKQKEKERLNPVPTTHVAKPDWAN